MVDHLDSTNLVPFKKRRNGYHLPGLQKEAEEQVVDEVDPELRPEEQGFVRHFLSYADILLRKASRDEVSDNESLAAEAANELPSTATAENRSSERRGKVTEIRNRNHKAA